MKKTFMILLLNVFVFQSLLMAQEIKNKSLVKRAYCKEIIAACEKAGFVRQGKILTDGRGKGIWPNCIKAITEGKIVEGTIIAVPSIPNYTLKKCLAINPEFPKGKYNK